MSKVRKLYSGAGLWITLLAVIAAVWMIALSSPVFAAKGDLVKVNLGEPTTSSTSMVSTYENEMEGPTVSAKGAIAYCPETGDILFGENVDERLDPLSLTKIMTVYVVMKEVEAGKLGLDDLVTVTKEDTQVPDSKIYLEEGEKVSVRNLIYGALLPSGNDAAAALGSKVSGNKKEFAKRMTQEAEKLGCSNTQFMNANGLIVKGHYSSPRDMALIAKAAFSYKFVQQVCQTREYKIPPTNKYDEKITLTLTNPFFTAEGKLKKPWQKYNVIAGKTGTWDIGNSSLIEMTEYGDKHIITVVMNDLLDQRYPDTVDLIVFGQKAMDANEKAMKNVSKDVKTESGSYPSFISDSKIAKRFVKWANNLSDDSTVQIHSAQLTENGMVHLTWTRKKGAEGYRIFRSDGGSYELIKTIDDAETLDYTDEKVSKNKFYHYYIRGCTRRGGLL